MNRIAVQMLTGDPVKYTGLIFGIAFATLLMTQQISIFVGIMGRTASQVADFRDSDLWVMDSRTRFIDEAPVIPDSDLQRIRGVTGVAWAVPLHNSQVAARLPDGNYRALILLGLDDATLVGAPEKMVAGLQGDLRQPDAVIIDKAGYEYMWPGQPVELDKELEINDRRARLVGICEASQPFTTLPVLYTRFSTARSFNQQKRSAMNFVLAKAAPGAPVEEVCRRIREETGLLALSNRDFFWKTIRYFLSSTGIPVNFGITIMLGFIVGAAITGQTFYLFTIENLKQFGALKAMGVTNGGILRMIMLQALIVGLIGYGIGIGLTAVFFRATSNITHLAGLYMNPWAAGGVAFAVLLIILATSILASLKVLFLEPAMVFRG
jgi:putative ABC transport system permease protein